MGLESLSFNPVEVVGGKDSNVHSTLTVATLTCPWKLVDLSEHEGDSRQIPQTLTEINGKKCFSKDQAFAHRSNTIKCRAQFLRKPFI